MVKIIKPPVPLQDGFSVFLAGSIELGNAGNWQYDPSLPSEAEVLSERKVSQWDVQAGLYLNPKTNFQLLLGCTDRLDSGLAPVPNRHTSWFYFGFRTNLHNRYLDF